MEQGETIKKKGEKKEEAKRAKRRLLV